MDCVHHWKVAFMDLHKLSLLSQTDGGPVTIINAIRGCRISPLDPTTRPLHLTVLGKDLSQWRQLLKDDQNTAILVETD
jgi:hypothetical protein